MRVVFSLIGTFVSLAGLVRGADPEHCRLPKGLYEDWVALDRSAEEKRAAIRRQYEQFVVELSQAGEAGEASLQTCCNAAADDRAGLVLCQLAAYVATGRTQSKTFLMGLPDTRTAGALLRDLDTIASLGGNPKYPKMFLPDGPAGKLMDELFLLVLDGNGEAVAKYFKLTSQADGEMASRRNKQMQILIREGPAVIVEHWSQLRRYKQQLRAAMYAVARSAPPEELQRFRGAIKAFCAKDNPDCPEILGIFEVRK